MSFTMFCVKEEKRQKPNQSKTGLNDKIPGYAEASISGALFVIYNVLFYRQYSVVGVAKYNIRGK